MEKSGQFRAPAAWSEGKNVGTRWIRGRVDSRARLDILVKTKILPVLEFELLILQSVA